jgi:hypothetical protein
VAPREGTAEHRERVPSPSGGSAGRHAALKRVAPWAITIGIFAVLFSKIPAGDVLARLESAEWEKFLLLMMPYSVFFCAVDAAVVRRAVSWFNVPVRYRDIFPIRATTYILTLLHALVGQGGLAVFLHRRYEVPFWQITGTVLVLWLVETYQLAFYSFVGAALAGEIGQRISPWPYAVLGAYLVFHLWFFSRPRAGAIGKAQVLQTFTRARPWQYAVLLLMKTPNLLAAVTVYWIAAPLFGIHLPFTTLLTYLPLVFFTTAIPAAAKLGPSQAAWVYFFGDRAAGADLVAFSLAAHLTFQVLNALLGLCFLKPAMRALEAPAVAGAPPQPD